MFHDTELIIAQYVPMLMDIYPLSVISYHLIKNRLEQLQFSQRTPLLWNWIT